MGPVDGGGAEFVAQDYDFAGFHSWASAPAASSADGGDGLHGVGPLRVYWNARPPAGAAAFPKGTMIVKETQEADVTQRTVFAMAKRGGPYNEDGADGWEWFSFF